MRLPWRFGFRFIMGRNNLDAKMLADHLRWQVFSGEPIPAELVTDIADMLDSPEGHRGPTLRLVLPKGGKRAKMSWLPMAAMAVEQINEGIKPDAVLREVAERYGVSKRTVTRALERYYAVAARDIENPH